MTHSTINDVDGRPALTFDCGDLPVDEAIRAAGHEPTGYFWEGVTRLMVPRLLEQLELEAEAGSFCARGEQAALEQLQTALEPLMEDPTAMTALIERAEADGFEFDD